MSVEPAEMNTTTTAIDDVRWALPRATLFISSNESRLKDIINRYSENPENVIVKVSIPELLLEAETGDCPLGLSYLLKTRGVLKATKNVIMLIPHLELLQLEVISAVPRKAVMGWLKRLVGEDLDEFPLVNIVGTFWDSQKQEQVKDSTYRSRLERLFPRVVRRSEEEEGKSNQLLGEMPVHDSFWAGIIGYDSVKLSLDRLVRWRWYRSESLERMGVGSGNSGVLLYGPSGCGKTFIAQALGREKGINFLSLKASDVYSKWYGESERAVREAFANARAKRPCILFLDEVDSLAPSRNADEDNAVGLRVLSTFLNEMDGVDTSNQGLIVVAATNRIEAVDDAALRPGRLGSKILVDVPSSTDREQLLRHFTAQTPLADDVNFEALTLRTMGHSVAKIENVCSMACYAALRDGSAEVHQSHFDLAICPVL